MFFAFNSVNSDPTYAKFIFEEDNKFDYKMA